MDSCLAGETVAFTGRMASLTRAEAAHLVHRYGGEYARSVSAETTLLVIGQEGWPLQADGRLTRKLRNARRFIETGSSVTVLTEEAWLGRLNLRPHIERMRRLLSPADLAQLLHITRDRLRAWIRAGLVTAAHEVSGVAYFDFRAVCGARTLCELANRGVTTEQIKRSLKQLRYWMPDAGNSLSLLERDGQLLVRTRDDVLAETTGQLYWDFSHDPCVLVTFEKAAPTADDWFERGWSHEQDGRLHEAAHAYRQALLTGESNAQICFNLGNVLHALGRREAAIERYSQAVELDSRFAEAWNNLGNVLCELGRCDEATSAYERALHVKPSFPDPHYNLADLLLNSGRQERAGHYWRQYLQLESCGPWAEYARMQLAGAR